jgi:hypothetical protein
MYLNAISALRIDAAIFSWKSNPFVGFNLDITTSFVTFKSKGSANEGTHTNGWHQGI